jgi:hypothetical protein
MYPEEQSPNTRVSDKIINISIVTFNESLYCILYLNELIDILKMLLTQPE